MVWACFVLATAYCSVPSQEETHRKDETAAQHVNPWAKDSAEPR
ncbi:hypothetical protein [Novosphingobium marinum]|nr:hypothetical protein [Novosphingobium marinum]